MLANSTAFMHAVKNAPNTQIRTGRNPVGQLSDHSHPQYGHSDEFCRWVQPPSPRRWPECAVPGSDAPARGGARPARPAAAPHSPPSPPPHPPRMPASPRTPRTPNSVLYRCLSPLSSSSRKIYDWGTAAIYRRYYFQRRFWPEINRRCYFCWCCWR